MKSLLGYSMKYANSLTVLFRHHVWANLRLFRACTELTNDQLTQSLLGTFGSIFDTLHHIVTAERAYISRIITGKRDNTPADAPPLSVADMISLTQQTGLLLIDWVEKIQADDIVEIDWDGTIRHVPKTILLTQAINHATEHRNQVMTILTQLGIDPPHLSAWAYFDQIEKET